MQRLPAQLYRKAINENWYNTTRFRMNPCRVAMVCAPTQDVLLKALPIDINRLMRWQI
jgi:hypothetical protein